MRLKVKRGIFYIVSIAIIATFSVIFDDAGYANKANIDEHTCQSYDVGGQYTIVYDGPGVKYLENTIGIQVDKSENLVNLSYELDGLDSGCMITYDDGDYIQVYFPNSDIYSVLERVRQLHYVKMASEDLSLRLR